MEHDADFQAESARISAWFARAEKVINRVSHAFPSPDDFSHWPECEEHRLSAMAACDLIITLAIGTETAAGLLNETAFYLYKKADYTTALRFYQPSLAIFLKIVGEFHTHTATILNNLALLFDALGAYDQALPLYQQALAIREQVLGGENQDTAASVDNLAALH